MVAGLPEEAVGGLQLGPPGDPGPQTGEEHRDPQQDHQHARPDGPDARIDAEEGGAGFQQQRENQQRHHERGRDQVGAAPGTVSQASADDDRQERQHARRQHRQDTCDQGEQSGDDHEVSPEVP